jgi:hypothetical protein
LATERQEFDFFKLMILAFKEISIQNLKDHRIWQFCWWHLILLPEEESVLALLAYLSFGLFKHSTRLCREYFERALLYIRDIASPFWPATKCLPTIPTKGFLPRIVVGFANCPHERYKDSSSEVIAAYEAVALLDHFPWA